MIPKNITAGLTLDIRLSYKNYSAAEWQGKLLLRGPASIDIPATADGNTYVFHVDAETTEKWTSGEYWYSVRGVKGADVIEMQKGETTIAPDIANAPDGYDGRTYAERVLDAIEAVIEKRASMDQQSYRINDRELSRTPIADLLKLRDQFRNEVNRERERKRGANPFSRRVLMVME